MDDALMASPLIGRGDVLGVEVSGTTVKINNRLKERKVTLRLQIWVDHQVPYEATSEQRFPEVNLPRPGQTFAVRIDPANPAKVAVDVSIPPPIVTMPRNDTKTGAAWVLANGTPCTVVLVANVPIGLRSADGHDGHLLTLTVIGGAAQPYQIKVTNAVPASALPLLYPGSKLHAKIGETPQVVVVDWSRGAAT